MGARFGHRARALCALGLAAVALAQSDPVRAESDGYPVPAASETSRAPIAPPRSDPAPAATDIPPACGSRQAFDVELRKRLGPTPLLDAVQLLIEPRADHFYLRVQIGDEVRELDDPSCTELFRAAVVVAVATLMRQQPPPPAPRTQPVVTQLPTPRQRSRRPALLLAAGAGVVAGSLPKPTLALELETKLLGKSFGAALGLRYLAPAEERDAENKGVQIQGLGLGLSGIFRPAPRWEARFGFAAQRLQGQGSGSIVEPQAGSAWAMGPTLSLGVVALEERRFWLGLGAEGQLNAVRGRFQILNYSGRISNAPRNVFVSPWLAASGFVRFGVVF